MNHRTNPPHTHLTLVHNARPLIRDCFCPRGTLAGRLPALPPVSRQADIAFGPLRAGSGTRLKILEAFALGVPVISTPIGHEGLEVLPGQHLLSASTVPDFIAAVESLLPDPAARQRLATAGRALAVARYDWAHIAARHEAVYEAMLAAAPSSS